MAAPAPAPHHRGYAPAASPRSNGVGIAALCCGLAGILAGLMPIMFQVSGALGIIAIVLGFNGLRRVRRGEAPSGGIAIAGLVTGVAALGLAAYGLFLVVSGMHQLNTDLNRSLHDAPRAYRTMTRDESHLIHQLLWIGNG